MRDETDGSSCGTKRAQIFTNSDTLFSWRKYAKLRTALFPYIYTAAHQVRDTGLPIMRHHVLNFAGDTEAIAQRYQYMFGDAFLVAPVVAKSAITQNVYLPGGVNWIDVSSHLLYDGATDGRFRIGYGVSQSGGKYVSVNAPMHVAPMFVREGTIVPSLDPSVYTVNDANTTTVITMCDMKDFLHLWVWPSSTTLDAQGETYDGGVFSLAPISTSNNSKISFSLYHPTASIFISQIAFKNVVVSVIDSITSKPIKKVQNWTDIVAVSTKPTNSGWFYDSQQMVLWMVLVNSNYKIEISFL